jgi:hypothetical protein
MACAFCRYRDFLDYLEEIDPQREPWNERGAKEFILVICGITSRRELDGNTAAAQRFHELVRKPFMAWRHAHQGEKS